MAGLTDPLKEVLDAKAVKLLAAELDIHTVGDLLRHYPRQYIARGGLDPQGELEEGEHITIIAEVRSVSTRPMRTRRGKITEAVIWDGTRELALTFFNAWKAMKELTIGRRVLFSGKVSKYRGKLQLTHPDYQLVDGGTDLVSAESSAEIDAILGKFITIYPATKGMQSWDIMNCVRQVMDLLDDPEDPLPPELLRERKLPGLARALRLVHRPEEEADWYRARARLKWDEALAMQVSLAKRRKEIEHRPAPKCPPVPDGLAAEFDKMLPFDLTGGQREIGEVLSAELASGRPMNRLLQGEVGSGKTIVALRAMLQVVDSGRQAALLAPTEVLAAQHEKSLRAMLHDLAMAGELGAAEQTTKITLLTGSLPAKPKKQALLDIASGAAGIAVGTHALLSETVQFADLGMVVVDEQHRFGVEQRDALRARSVGGVSPHVLVMTATPIPRTVAMTVYGDLDTSTMRELPPGRSPISTTVVPMYKAAWFARAWSKIIEESTHGRQAYVVCPRIGDEETPPDEKDPEKRKPPLSVVEVAERLTNGPLADLRLGILHGRLTPEEKDAVMAAFVRRQLDVIVSTTVVEVGVDVPNATVMVVMDADRFGISQLHQLRGRVGRGGHPGICLLVTDMAESSESYARLSLVASTLDGFELARADLEQRREGDILGEAQSGRRSGLKLLSLLQDETLVSEARVIAQEIIDADPQLTEHPALVVMMENILNPLREEFLGKG